LGLADHRTDLHPHGRTDATTAKGGEAMTRRVLFASSGGFATLAISAMLLVSPIGWNFGSSVGREISAGQGGRHPMGPPRPDAPSTRGCRLELSLPRHAFLRDELIGFDLRLVNASGDPVTIWVSGFWPNHRIIVRDEGGDEAPLTELGRSLMRAFSPGGGRDKNFPRVIQPGDSYDRLSVDRPGVKRDPQRWGYGLSDLYQLAAGKYRVEVTYHDERAPTPMKVTSNAVEFEVR
jgi:hypothetical protein